MEVQMHEMVENTSVMHIKKTVIVPGVRQAVDTSLEPVLTRLTNLTFFNTRLVDYIHILGRPELIAYLSYSSAALTLLQH